MNYRLDFQDPERTYFRLRTRQKLPGPKRTRIIPAWYSACSGQARSPAVDPPRKALLCSRKPRISGAEMQQGSGRQQTKAETAGLQTLCTCYFV